MWNIVESYYLIGIRKDPGSLPTSTVFLCPYLIEPHVCGVPRAPVLNLSAASGR